MIDPVLANKVIGKREGSGLSVVVVPDGDGSDIYAFAAVDLSWRYRGHQSPANPGITFIYDPGADALHTVCPAGGRTC